MAISRMGPSVINTAVSTALAVCVLAFAKFYVFIVFFKTWITFVSFGLANSVLLLPVILSIIGSTSKATKPSSKV